MSLRPGDLVGKRYIVDAFMGASETGLAYRAHHHTVDHPVVVKLHSTKAQVADRARLQRSAVLMARIRHPAVVSILDHWLTDDGNPVVVTEYVEGETLQRYLARTGTMPWKVAVRVTLGILDGLSAIHEAKVLHRNLKPGNIMLVSGGESLVKLVDLGFARSLVPEEDIKVTSGGIVVGTPRYMAPELIKDVEGGVQTDLYAAGLILYEMLSGDLHDGHLTPTRALLARADGAPPPPVAPEGQPKVPDALAAIVTWTLKPHPRNRPHSARELAKSLQELVAADTATLETLPAKIKQRRRVKTLRLQTADGPGLDAARRARIRGVLAARLPAIELTRKEMIDWLGELVGPDGLSMQIGQIFWVAAIAARDDGEAWKRAEAITDAIRGAFGEITPVAAQVVEEGFVLTPATLTGTAAPPVEIVQLLDVVATEPGPDLDDD